MFLVFSLPRSRSTWLSHLLTHDGRTVVHDLAPGCDSIAEFNNRLSTYDGACETGAVLGWRVVRRDWPEAKLVVVRRDLVEVYKSILAFGVDVDQEDLLVKARALDELAAEPGVLVVEYPELATLDGADRVFHHCLGEHLSLKRWDEFRGQNLQVDVVEELNRIAGRREAIDRLKAEVAEQTEVCLRQAPLQISLEPWATIWRDMRPLTELHSLEVDSGVEPRRKFEVDSRLIFMMEAAGAWKVLGARRADGRLVGYCTWTLSPDVESRGLLIAMQGAWYVLPGYPRAALRLFDESIRALRAFGVKMIFPHHRTQGRGASLGKFFHRRGAKHIQQSYSLWIGEEQVDA